MKLQCHIKFLETYLFLAIFFSFRGTTDAETKSVPFRKWYANLIELKALLLNPRIAVFTATASKITKRKIFEHLQLNPFTTANFEKDPTKDNLRYAVSYVSNEMTLLKVFGEFITEIIKFGTNAEGTLIFCQTRKQCSLIYRTFELALGDQIYLDGRKLLKNCLVEMFHAGTPDSVKEHILSNITSQEGHIRILICTIAFGMGVDCQYITRVVHFGGSKCMESYLQECGRAGRNGQLSSCYLLHNGMLLRHSGESVKDYVLNSNCRQKEIGSMFPKGIPEYAVKGCHCCDVCSNDCTCGEKTCNFGLSFTKSVSKNVSSLQTRPVSRQDKEMLRDKLNSYAESLVQTTVDSCTPVSYPNIYHEFGSLQVKQILDNLHMIFTLEDIKCYVEIWRDIHANNVLVAVHEVFNDFELDTSELALFLDEDDDDFLHDWAEIRDETDLDPMERSSLIQDFESMDISVDNNSICIDDSAFVAPIIDKLKQLSK